MNSVHGILALVNKKKTIGLCTTAVISLSSASIVDSSLITRPLGFRNGQTEISDSIARSVGHGQLLSRWMVRRSLLGYAVRTIPAANNLATSRHVEGIHWEHVQGRQRVLLLLLARMESL